jgi:PST family polysaccharide transporter
VGAQLERDVWPPATGGNLVAREIREIEAADVEEPAEGESGRLARQVKKVVLWSLLNAGSARILGLCATLVIVRLVTPRQYGVYAVGFLILTAITSMNELGVSVVVARAPGGPTALGPTATTLSLATSVALYLGVFGLAPTMASLLGSPSATGVIRLIGLNVVLDGLTSIPTAFLMRSFQQGRRTSLKTLSTRGGRPTRRRARPSLRNLLRCEDDGHEAGRVDE